jgi:hypothetical protein
MISIKPLQRTAAFTAVARASRDSGAAAAELAPSALAVLCGLVVSRRMLRMIAYPRTPRLVWFAAMTLGVIVLGGLPCLAHAEGKFRVGQVFVVGNTETPAYLIGFLLPFRPGDTVSGGSLRLAQSRLRRLGLWARPTVMAFDSIDMAGWKDVVVQIEERPWNWLLFYVGHELALFRLTGDLECLNGAGLRIRDKIVDWLGEP